MFYRYYKFVALNLSIYKASMNEHVYFNITADLDTCTAIQLHKYLILISFPEQHLKYQCFTQYSHFIIVLNESLSVLNSTFTENASYCKDVVLVLQHQRWWHLSDLYNINGKFFSPYFSDFPSLFDDLKKRFYISCTCREGMRWIK